MADKKTDRRAQKTRKALCDALCEILSEKQLNKVTVQEIADMADVNRVTFYKHFLDVYDLYENIEKDTLVELGLLMLQLEDLSAEQRFSHIIKYVSENRPVFMMIFSSNATDQLRSKLSSIIEGVFRQVQTEKNKADIKDKEIEYISCYRAFGSLAVISKWVRGGFKEPEDFIVKAVSRIDSIVADSLGVQA